MEHYQFQIRCNFLKLEIFVWLSFYIHIALKLLSQWQFHFTLNILIISIALFCWEYSSYNLGSKKSQQLRLSALLKSLEIAKIHKGTHKQQMNFSQTLATLKETDVDMLFVSTYFNNWVSLNASSESDYSASASASAASWTVLLLPFV